MPIFTPVDFDPFADQKEIEKLTLTNEPQREIWLSCIIGGTDANLSYNESVSLEIKGDLDFAAFKKAVDNLVLRHEALRSTISPNGETLIIYKNVPVDFQLQDISGLTESDKKQHLDTFLRREMDTPLDLQEGPLFRVFMHKTGDDAYYLTIIKHHVIGDGWSTGVILEDLARMYNAYSNGLEFSADMPPQISDYEAAQESFKLTKDYKETENYWLNLYKDNVPVLDMPTDHPRVSPRTYKGNRLDHPLPVEMVDKLKASGAKAGASLVTTLLTAFEVFLYQKTKQKDIVVGLPSSGQSASELYDVVGNCVNLLPLRSQVDPSRSFSDQLKKRKKEVLDAYDHQRLTFGELIKKLYIPRDPSRITLVPVLFNVDMGMDNAVAFEGLTFKLISNPRAYEAFEIFLNLTKSKKGITLEWSYNTGLFDPETMEAFNKSYIHILEDIIANPAISIADLSGVKEEFRVIIPAEEIYIPSGETTITLFEEATAKYADKTAVIFNNESLTYQQLNKKADEFAGYLTANGIINGDIVGLSVDRSIEMLVALLAVLKAGAVYLPLDPEYPLDRIEFMLEDSAAKMLLVSDSYKGRYKTTANEVVIEDIWPDLGKYQPKSSAKAIDGDDLAYILYTSGSTGKPKGVKITHHNLVNFLISMQTTPGIKATDRLLAITTISFDIAGLELYLPLITGAELMIADAEAAKDGRILLSMVEEKGISMMQATPSTWQMMLDSGWIKKYPIKVLAGGEALPKDLADKLLTVSASVWNMYGPTETTIWSTTKQILPGDKLITIGRPINNTQVYVMDEQGRPLPDGMTGELYIGGDGVAEGYLNRAELTSEKFVADPYSGKNGARLYRTGDLGKILQDGDIQCLGRIDQQVKIRGHRIELGEIENILATLDGVKQAVVIAQDDVLLNKYLVAFVITGSKEAVSKAQLHEWWARLSEKLPAYMVPEDIISIESFPLTPNGKIDRKAFPKADRTKIADTADKVAPRNPTEKLVADIWAKTLGITDPDVRADFFELGGHSLLAVRVMIAIEKETGERLPLATLFNNSTIEKLAKQLAGGEDKEAWDTIVPIKTTGSKPPLFLVHGSGLNLLMFRPISEHFEADQPLYGVQAIGLTKPEPVPTTVAGIAAYHIEEILRVNPDGPYSIAGYSYGGFIAYEIARQLMAAGKHVKFVGMIDTNASALIHPSSSTARVAKKVSRQFHKVPFFVNSFIKYPKESLEYQQLVFKRKFSNTFTPVKEEVKDTYTLYEEQIRAGYNKAIDSYVIEPLDIKVSLFRVEKRLYFLDDQKYLGWDNFALKGVKIYIVPGDHKTFLEDPNDEKFAGIMQQALDNTN